jgi:hypothetical protein
MGASIVELTSLWIISTVLGIRHAKPVNGRKCRLNGQKEGVIGNGALKLEHRSCVFPSLHAVSQMPVSGEFGLAGPHKSNSLKVLMADRFLQNPRWPR